MNNDLQDIVVRRKQMQTINNEIRKSESIIRKLRAEILRRTNLIQSENLESLNSKENKRDYSIFCIDQEILTRKFGEKKTSILREKIQNIERINNKIKEADKKYAEMKETINDEQMSSIETQEKTFDTSKKKELIQNSNLWQKKELSEINHRSKNLDIMIKKYERKIATFQAQITTLCFKLEEDQTETPKNSLIIDNIRKLNDQIREIDEKSNQLKIKYQMRLEKFQEKFSIKQDIGVIDNMEEEDLNEPIPEMKIKMKKEIENYERKLSFITKKILFLQEKIDKGNELYSLLHSFFQEHHNTLQNFSDEYDKLPSVDSLLNQLNLLENNRQQVFNEQMIKLKKLQDQNLETSELIRRKLEKIEFKKNKLSQDIILFSNKIQQNRDKTSEIEAEYVMKIKTLNLKKGQIKANIILPK